MKTNQPNSFKLITMWKTGFISMDHASVRPAEASHSGRCSKPVLKYCFLCLVAACMTVPLFSSQDDPVPLFSSQDVPVHLFSSQDVTVSLFSSQDVPVPGDDVALMEAYRLRMNGKADEAASMLSALLRNDSTSAAAYFELARTKQHLILGGAQIAWDEVVQAGRQALFYAPENTTYAFYYAVSCFTDAYMGLMRQQQDAMDRVTKAAEAFEAVLALDPDCCEAMLYLVDLYGVLPDEMGGDREKAEMVAASLEQKDPLFGAVARSRLLPDAEDQVGYWEACMHEETDDRFLEELGRAYLLQLDTENGTRYFLEAIQADPAKRYLMMHLVRYHFLMTQQNPDQRQEHLEQAEELARDYLEAKPELTLPQKAHTCQMLALIRNIAGDVTGRDVFLAQAASYDPFYSRASGVPAEMLYCPPEDVRIQYSSFFMPF